MKKYQRIFETIDDKYARGQLGSFEVIIMIENGYINISKICKEYNKKIGEWLNNKYSINIFQNLENQLNESSEKPIKSYYVIKGVRKELRGTYVHPELLIPIILWCSHKNALDVSRIVLDYYSKKMEETKKMEENEEKPISKEQENFSLKNEILELKKMTENVIKQNEKQSEKIENQTRKIDEILEIIKNHPEVLEKKLKKKEESK